MWRVLAVVVVVIPALSANVYYTIDAAYPPPACAMYGAKVIFRARVMERFRYPDSEQVMTRLSVQERFKGLGPEITEVIFAGEIDAHHDWIFYESADYTSERYRQFLAAPASWRKLYNAPVYAASQTGCIDCGPFEAAETDLNFLRSAAANRSAAGSIEGFAQQNWALMYPNEASWLPGAVVEAHSWKGDRKSVV